MVGFADCGNVVNRVALIRIHPTKKGSRSAPFLQPMKCANVYWQSLFQLGA